MRYRLDNMDYYHMMAIGTRAESVPLIQVYLSDSVDPDRLRRAAEHTLCNYSLLKTRIVFDREYYLEENDEPIILHHCSIENRPDSFGHDTNGFPWRLCHDENKISFEWCHAVTDGRGAMAFLSALLADYFDVPANTDHSGTEPPFARYYDKTAHAPAIPNQPLGYANRRVKANGRGAGCLSHRYAIESGELVSIARSLGATPTALIAPLFSRALHECLPEQLKKANVRFSINIDTRIPMGFGTMHNAAIFEPVSYLPSYDDLDLRSLCGVYKRLLDSYRQPDYIVSRCTALIDDTDALYRMPAKNVSKAIMKAVVWWLKEHDTNAQLSYLGQLPFHPDVLKKVRDCWFYMWPDVGYCNLNMVDCNGKFNLNICENFADEQLINRVMTRICDYGLHFTREDETFFRQAHMEFA